MIAALLGLQTAIAMRNNSVGNYLRASNSFDKNSDMMRVQSSTMYKIACAQEDSYRKLLNDNIKRSFSIFA